MWLIIVLGKEGCVSIIGLGIFKEIIIEKYFFLN